MRRGGCFDVTIFYPTVSYSLRRHSVYTARIFSVTDAVRCMDPKESAHWCFILQSALLSLLHLNSAAPQKQTSPPFSPSEREGRRRKDGACMCEWLRNPNSWRHCYVPSCLYFMFFRSFSNILRTYKHTNRPLFTRRTQMYSTHASLISAGRKADLGGDKVTEIEVQGSCGFNCEEKCPIVFVTAWVSGFN